MNEQAKEKISYYKTSLFHPFYAFYEIRFRKKGSLKIAFVLMCLFGILQCAAYQYTGFVMNKNPVHEMNSVSIFLTYAGGVVLFTISNWAVTTLFNGKGGMGDIFTVVCYSLTPLIALDLIVVIASNFVIIEEVMILQAIHGIALVYFIFLAMAGLCTIHEYSLKENIISILATFIAAAIIIFIGVLFFTMIEKMAGFIWLVVEEAMRRL
ncbi:MAG TPA: Yip1 family protein [Oscillospiraceae bacterium]|nr:Yip1 family protein [Oscillospiraceae bacterium]